MATILLLRTITFILIPLVSLALLGICAYLQYIITKYTDTSPSFPLLGVGVACLTAISLPLFLILDHFRRHVLTSMIRFELGWFAVLCVLWAITASDTTVTGSYYFPTGCIYKNIPLENSVCYEFTTVEALAFFNFFSALVYFITLLSYTIININALHGKSIWTSSVKEATLSIAAALDQGSGVPMSEGQFNPMPAMQNQLFSPYSPNFPLSQPHNGYLQQVPFQGPPVQPYLNAYPQQVPLQGPPSQQFDASLQLALPSRLSFVSHGQNKQSNSRPTSSGGPQRVQIHYPSYPSGINPQDISSPLPNSNGRPELPQQQHWSSLQSASASVPVYDAQQSIPV